MSPFITLKIEDHVPHLFYTPADGKMRKLTEKDENIAKLILNIGEHFNLRETNMDDDVQMNRLLLLSNEADSTYLETTPDIDAESLEFELDVLLDKLISDAKDIEKEYTDVEIDPELRSEIDRNQNIDIMAGLLETLYKIIIAKTLLAAYELEIAEVHFQSNENYPRFTERLGDELQKVGLELIID